MFKTTMTMYYRIYNTRRSRMYDNDSTKDRRGEWRHTVVRFPYYT